MSFDLAYSHLFVKSASIDLTSTANPWFIPGATAAYAGDVAAHVDIISVALKYRWDNPAPAPTSTLYHK
jgi:long-chain fatty acid transport protein